MIPNKTDKTTLLFCTNPLFYNKYDNQTTIVQSYLSLEQTPKPILVARLIRKNNIKLSIISFQAFLVVIMCMFVDFCLTLYLIFSVIFKCVLILLILIFIFILILKQYNVLIRTVKCTNRKMNFPDNRKDP